MLIEKTLFKVPLRLVKKKIPAHGSRQSYFFKNDLPLRLNYKSLMLKINSRAGRNNTGRIVINTKKSQLKNPSRPKINYNFRSRSLVFISGFLLLPRYNKLVSLLMLSSGIITFTPTPITHFLFDITRFKSILGQKYEIKSEYKIISPLLNFSYSFFTIGLLPKNRPISLVEAVPTKGITYARSAGSSSRILKMNSLTSTALVQLPSGVKKILSTYAIASLGSVHIPEHKKCKNNKAGFLKSWGKKSIVRGVAKNPVDHPHGGRTKAIRYQRTP
jgi:large subunit ribosomal protein L2